MATLPSTSSTPALGEIISPLEVYKILPNAIDYAKQQGDLKEYPSTVQDLEEEGIKYQIRLCPSLASKEAHRAPLKNIAPDPADVSTVVETIVKHDPFTPPFTSLYLGELKDPLEEGGGYYVLLNKYAVVKGHFLLTTKDYQSQSDPLSPSQLVQIYLLLLASAQSQTNTPYFAFFNCGLLSGASQPHKHIQFIPGEPPIELLATGKKVENELRPFLIDELPYAAYVKRLERDIVDEAKELVRTSSFTQDHETLARLSSELSMAFMSLLDEMYHALRVEDAENLRSIAGSTTIKHPNPAQTTDGDGMKRAEPTTPSYNVLMTLGHIYLFPRASEKFELQNAPSDPLLQVTSTPPPSLYPASPSSNTPVPPPSASFSAPTAENTSRNASDPSINDSEPYLSLPINSLGFSGFILVKSHEQFERVREVGVGKILKAVGRAPMAKGEDRRDDVIAELE